MVMQDVEVLPGPLPENFGELSDSQSRSSVKPPRKKLCAPREIRLLQLDETSRRRDAVALGSKRARRAVHRFDSTEIEPRKSQNKKSPSIFPPTPRAMTGLDYCQEIHADLLGQHHIYSWPFHHPVDATLLKLEDYHDVIKFPMDLGTVRAKLDNGNYSSVFAFAADIRLMFANCYLYNPEEHEVTTSGRKLHKIFEAYLKKIPPILMNSSGMYFRTSPPSVQSPAVKDAPRKRKFHDVRTVGEFCGKEKRQQVLMGLMSQMKSLKEELAKLLVPKDQALSGKIPRRQLKAKRTPRKKSAKLPSASLSPPISIISTSSETLTSGKLMNVVDRNSYLSDEEEESVSMGREEIRQMSWDVSKLPLSRLVQVVQIVQRNEPKSSFESESDEVNIDFNLLREITLRKIRLFLKNPQRKFNRKSVAGTLICDGHIGADEGILMEDEDDGNFSVSSSESDEDSASSDE